MNLMRSIPTDTLRSAVLAFALIAAPPAAYAAEPNWPNGPYKYFIIDQDARDVLVEFGRNLNLPIQVSANIAGRRIHGGIPELSAKDFLSRICDSYGLVWYFDGTVLHVNVDGEVSSEFISLNLLKSETIMSRLEELGIPDSRFNIRITENGKVLSVSGPPPYRALVRKTVSALEDALRPRTVRESKGADDLTVRVFRGGS